MARRKRRKSTRKTYKLKSTAKRAAKGRSIYKVIGGWRISRARRRRRKYPLRRRRAARKGIVLTRTVSGRKPRRKRYYKRSAGS